MKYYKNPETSEVYAYETEEERQEWGAPELVEMTPEEVEAHLNPPPEPIPIPEAVSKAQGKAALIQAGLWQAVTDYVDSIEDPTEKALAEIALNDTQEWLRSSPLLNSMATALGLTGEDLDGLFIAAANIEF